MTVGRRNRSPAPPVRPSPGGRREFITVEIPHPVIALVTGMVSGFLLSVPVGPVNMTIINEGARNGFRWALLISAGAVFMETIFCGIAFMGFASFFQNRTVKAAMELVSFLLVLILGWKYLLAKSVDARSELEERIEKRIEARLKPHSAFMTGFVRVLGNPAVLLVWLTMSGVFVTRDWVGESYLEKAVCVAGVATGNAVWFFLLSFGVSRGHGRFSPATLLRIERISGIFLLGAAVVIATRIVGVLKNHH